jgi:hypothetical protein
LIEEKLIASGADEVVIISGVELFAKIEPFLYLKRNHPLYVLIAEKDRASAALVAGLPGISELPPSKLYIKGLDPGGERKSAWDSKGVYRYLSTNMQTVTKKAKKHTRSEEEANEAEESNGDYESNNAVVDTTIYSSNIMHYKDAQKLTLQNNVFNDDKPRPFVHRVSMVYFKDPRQRMKYVIVLDSILDMFMGESDPNIKAIPLLAATLKNDPSNTLSHGYATVYEVIHGEGSFQVFKQELKEEHDKLKLYVDSTITGSNTIIIPAKQTKHLSKFETVYSSVQTPTSSDLTFTPGEYKFSIGYLGRIPVLLEHQEQIDLISLLEQVDSNPEVYRMFSHNVFNREAYKKNNYANCPEGVKLYINKFKEHLGRDLPNKQRTIPRHTEWEEQPSPQDVQALIDSFTGDPIETVINFYRKTGKGISYWYVRSLTKN